MDMMAMVSSIMAMKAAGTQQQIQNLDHQTEFGRGESGGPDAARHGQSRPRRWRQSRYCGLSDVPADTHLSDLILRSRVSGVSKDEWHQPGHMVRDGATRLLTMRV